VRASTSLMFSFDILIMLDDPPMFLVASYEIMQHPSMSFFCCVLGSLYSKYSGEYLFWTIYS